MVKKFIQDANNRTIKNPAHPANQPTSNQAASSSSNSAAIPVITNLDDMVETFADMNIATPASTALAAEVVQSDAFSNALNVNDPDQALDALSEYFERFEIPLGLLDKLLHLMRYKLTFILDDSGSMRNPSDVLRAEAMSEQMRAQFAASPAASSSSYASSSSAKRVRTDPKMTRWEEMQDRMHALVDVLAYIPCKPITITFLNRTDTITLDHAGKTPEQFKQEAHARIAAIFTSNPSGYTPIYNKLQQAFNAANEDSPSMIYLITDGCPYGGPQDRSGFNTELQVGNLIKHRRNPECCPLTIIGCGEDGDLEWTTKIDDEAKYVAQLDDYRSEAAEVLQKQGPGLPFTRGFWMICQLVAAINPNDLDAMDEKLPFSKHTLSNLMGYPLTPADYSRYWDQNPFKNSYQQYFPRFSTEALDARKIVSEREQQSIENSLGIFSMFSNIMGAGRNQQSVPTATAVPVHSATSAGSSSNPMAHYGYPVAQAAVVQPSSSSAGSAAASNPMA